MSKMPLWLVVGSEGGIGSAVIDALPQGHRCIGLDIISSLKPEGTFQLSKICRRTVDVTKPGDVARALRDIPRGSISTCVFAAALGPAHPDPEMCVRVNVMGVLQSLQEVLNKVRVGASMIFFGSPAGLRFVPSSMDVQWFERIRNDLCLNYCDLPQQPSYALSKWAIGCLALSPPEWIHSRRFRIICVVPGPTAGRMADEMRHHCPDSYYKLIGSANSRLSSPESVARVVVAASNWRNQNPFILLMQEAVPYV